MLSNKPAKKSKSMGKKKVATYKTPVVASSWNIPTPNTVAPTKLKTTFVYVENGLGLNPGVGGTASAYVFDLNSLFDPNVSGAGHQPAGYDQMMAIYEEYLVYGVKYRIMAANSEASLEAIHGVTISDEINTKSDPRIYMENGNCQWKCASGRGGPSLTEFTGYVDLAKFHGVEPQNYMDDSDYKALSGSSPSERAYLHIWCAPMNASSDIGDQTWYVELTYYAVLSGGKLNNLS